MTMHKPSCAYHLDQYSFECDCGYALIERLRKRAEIRRQIPGRKSVEEGKPDRIADLLDEAADEIERLRANAS